MSHDSHMTIVEHLMELRRRLIWSVVVVALCTLLSFWFLYDVSRDVLRAPLDALDPDTTNVIARYNPVVGPLRPYLAQEGVPKHVDLHGTTLAEPFTVKFKLALLCGALLSAPFLLYQAWAFLRAGLTRRERKTLSTYFPLSLALFIAGVAFAYFVAVPVAALFLLSVDPEIIPILTYAAYFRLVALTVGLFGVGFQLPLVAMALARLEIVSARTMARNRGVAIVLMFAIGAILTPPEPLSQCLLALPLIGLFELGILLAKTAESKMATAAFESAAGQSKT